MAEYLRAAALCYALVDHKVTTPRTELPEARFSAAESYLANIENPIAPTAGGSVANTATIFSKYSEVPTRLYYRVGDDWRGRIFSQATGSDFGPPQIGTNEHTGICILALSDSGEIEDEITIYGAAESVTIPATEQNQIYDIVFSNINTLRQPALRDHVSGLVHNLDRGKGMLAFRLSGAHSALADPNQAREALASIPRVPEICFGNDVEAANLTGETNHHKALMELLPDTRVLILTSRAASIAIRFEGETIALPVAKAKEVVDVTGAGDHFMGVTMGELVRYAYSDWTADLVKQAASKGIEAAAGAIRTTRSRLTTAELKAIGTDS
ncbi:MAG TPA: carbohydrate kinase family protein [Candidatus Saccharimonadales bacterium]|nr:carbohydrate kinase family protein [Candidatus Saccharimonadales bacterium]